ncbi:hypothetical protein Hanom_Chr03g00263651 [Helianthus anomalus]
MDGVNEPYENGKISNLLDPDAIKKTFGRKSQNWPNLMDENGILLFILVLVKMYCFEDSFLCWSFYLVVGLLNNTVMKSFFYL